MHMGIEILDCTKGTKFSKLPLSETLTRTEYDLNVFLSFNAVIVVLFIQSH